MFYGTTTTSASDMISLRVSQISFRQCPRLTILRHKSTDHWAQLKRRTLPREMALNHFDNFYGKVYGRSWPSIRLGLLCPNKYVAVVNNFGDVDETFKLLEEQLQCIDLTRYYKRHYKKYQRYRLRMEILERKKAAKRAKMAEELGVPESEIDPDSVVVSDVSDSELKGLMSSGSEAEDFIEMFQTDVERRAEEEFFHNPAGRNIDLTDFVPPSDMKRQEDIELTDKPYYSFYESTVEVAVDVIEQKKLEFPETLRIFTHNRGNLDDFPQPKVSSGMDIFNYYCMDGASILPVLCLDIQPRDVVGDFCSAPGGKALAAILTLLPSRVLCNDISESRLSRLKNVLKMYIPKMNATNDMVDVRFGDALEIREFGIFDKILLDVQCTNDRKSVKSDENNYFKASRMKERIELPQEQCKLLVHALTCLKPGGTLVYSTCSLSPIQNDGVVHMALKKLQEETDIRIQVTDLKEAMRPLRGLFRFFRPGFKYGQQVVPFMPSNFGPMYFSKLTRLA